MGTKVSVILPVYNVSDYLRQCMDSIVGQTLKDIEIICVDDGSTDDSLAILKEYEAKDQRVKVIQQANAGAGAARNKGLEIAFVLQSGGGIHWCGRQRQNQKETVRWHVMKEH